MPQQRLSLARAALATMLALACAATTLAVLQILGSAPAAAHQVGRSATLSLDGPGWRVAGFDVGDGVRQGVQEPAYDDGGWYSTAVPSTQYQVLLDHHGIDDPYAPGSSATWPGSREWWYRRSLVVPSTMSGRLVRLHIEGAMENSEVFVNGVEVGGTTGMYDETWLDVSSALRYGARNVIAIRTFPSAGSWTTYPSIAANSTYWKGFQYGRNLRVLGLWRGVELEATDQVYVQDTFVRTVGNLTARSTTATLRVTSTLHNASSSAQTVVLHWRLAGSDFAMDPLAGARSVQAPPGDTAVTYDITVSGPRLHLWWPNDYGSNLPDGDRYLYRLTTDLGSVGNPTSTQVTDDIGIRSLTYRMTSGAPADDYPLEYVVNGEPIYLQGGNWVPSDGLYRPAVMARNYERDLALARDAHFRMLRVWGGGIEENPEFYSLASRYGILILQEFWHFQASYQPDPAVWSDNAGDIVKRLRNFPAVARYDGGNELTGVTEGDRAKAEAMPWVQLVAQAYETYDGTRGDFLGTDPAGGSCHRWDHLHMIGVEGYELDHGALCPFLSELGMNSAPAESTLASYDGTDRAAQLYRAIGEEYVYPNEYGGYESTADLTAKSQLAQAIGMSYNMSWAKTHKWTNSGALVWQLNDMAPMVGWGAIDFDNHPKAAYYYLKRAYAPVSITAVYDKYYFDPGAPISVDVHALNDTTEPLTGYTAHADLVGLDGTPLGTRSATVDVPANADGGAVKALTASFTAPTTRGVFLLHLRLDDSHGRQVATDDVLMTTERNRSLYTLGTSAHPDDLHLRHTTAGQIVITNDSSRPAYGIELETAADQQLSDDFFTLMPGASEKVAVRSRDGQPYDGPITVTQVGAEPASDDLALGRPTYASQDDYTYRTGTNTHSDRLALYATDGDAMYTAASGYSQWQATTSGAAWLETDLGAPHLVAQVTVLWGADHATDYAIQVSDDDVTWRTVRTVTGGTGGAVALSFDPVQARFVRLAGTASTGAYDVRELRIYDHDVPAPTQAYVAGAVEVERLPQADLSAGATRTTVRDDTLSDGAADRIGITAPGGSIGYDLAVQARSYDVRVGVRTQPSGGTFQASVAGTALGTPQDTYAAAPGVKELDLGTHTFTTPGTDTFTFAATGKNPAGNGYDLGIDYVLLVPLDHVYEAEDLTATTSAGDSHASFTDAHMSGGAGDKLNANGAGDYVAYQLPVTQPGTYEVRVGVKMQDTRGIFQASIDGAPQGAVHDTYAGSDTYTEFDLGQHTFTAGSHEVRFTVTGRNPASLGYSLAVDYLKLTPPLPAGCQPAGGRFETECLTATTSPGDSHAPFDDANLSAAKGDKLNANAAGDYIEYQLPVETPGSYDIRLAVKEQDTRGIFQASIDGTAQGTQQDTYQPQDTYVVIDLGRHDFSTAGTHELRLTVTGRNPQSLGYSLATDYVELTP